MSCRYATETDEYHGWECGVTEGACAFLVPSEKACYETYGEGPLAFEEDKGEQEAAGDLDIKTEYLIVTDEMAKRMVKAIADGLHIFGEGILRISETIVNNLEGE